MPDKIQVFISSKMEELSEERRIIERALDEMVVDAWVFETTAGAKPESIRETYLKALAESDLYLGIFWKGYGEYTIDDEFMQAKDLGIPCFIYEKRTELEHRDPKLQEFLDSISGVADGLTIQWYTDPGELHNYVKRDVAAWLRDQARDKTVALKSYPHFSASPAGLRRSFDALMGDKLRNFVGREFVFEAVQDFLMSNEAGYYVIRGEPGIGKSALMAKLINEKGYVHHFNIATQGINSPGQFLENVLQQLISRYDLKYEQWPERATKDGGFLAEALAQVASIEDHRPIVIAIDALDESDTTLLKTSENFLFLPTYLPEGVYVVASTRPLDDAEFRLDVNRMKTLHLEADSDGNMRDISQYIEQYLDKKSMQFWLTENNITANEFITTLKKKSEGNFMYLHYVLPAIEAGDYRQEILDELPNGLLGYYQRHWREMRAKNEEDFIKVYEPVVCILGVAKEPVTIRQISNWTGIDPSLVNKGLRSWREFLDKQPSEEGEIHRIYHASFQDFLYKQVKDLGKYDGMIADYYLQQAGLNREES
jgi:predicted enzyme related to lactoylglutathione lyase